MVGTRTIPAADVPRRDGHHDSRPPMGFADGQQTAIPTAALVIFTCRSKWEIMENGGSQAWRLNPERAAGCKYLVCTRNQRYFGASPHLQTKTPEQHGAAFLVGRITAVDPSHDWPGRYIVRFEECACLDPQPIVWHGAQKPVRYVNDISQLGIQPGRLDWRVVVSASSPEDVGRKLPTIRVPPPGRGRGRARKRLAERRTAYRFLAAVSGTGLLAFPLWIKTGERPDVVLEMTSSKSVGIEITEAVPPNEARIAAYVEDEEIECVRHVPPHRIDERPLSQEQIENIARGETMGPPQMGDSIERNWVEAVIDRIERKSGKFRQPGFRAYPDNWLLIHDNWSPHPWPDDDMQAKMLAPCIANLAGDIPFSRIFVQDERAVWEFARETGVRKHLLVAD